MVWSTTRPSCLRQKRWSCIDGHSTPCLIGKGAIYCESKTSFSQMAADLDEIWQDLLLHGMYLWVQFDPDRWSRPNETTSFSVIPVPKMHHNFSSMQRISMISVATLKCVSPADSLQETFLLNTSSTDEMRTLRRCVPFGVHKPPDIRKPQVGNPKATKNFGFQKFILSILSFA